jgi:hypothetical protein
VIEHVLHEPNLVSHYQKEYINLLNYYNQVNRPSLFVKYYNISLSSTYEEKSFSTYDHYMVSDIKFNIYEYTPLFFAQTINNRSNYQDDNSGFSLQTQSGVIVNTIKRPRINDLIELYQPIENSFEIFRVMNFNTVTTLLHSDPSTEWFELEIEYAPIETTQSLKILNHYIYDLSDEKNILLTEYKQKIMILQKIDEILKKINKYYSKQLDLYLLDFKYIPISLNDLIYLLKTKFSSKFKRLIEAYKTPYGFKYHTSLPLPYYETNPLFNLKEYDNYIDVFNLETKEIEQIYWENVNKYNTELEELFYNSYQLSKIIMDME